MENKELIEYFIKRTNEHIARVINNANTLYKKNKLFKDLPAQALKHDLSKLVEPERTPYIVLTHYYKLKQEGKELKTEDSIMDKIREAAFHHIKNNSHHPEYWDNNIQLLGKDKRTNQKVNAQTMPFLDIAEMVCDWMAMSQEMNNDVTEFANSVVNKKFLFTENQINLIYKCIFLLK